MNCSRCCRANGAHDARCEVPEVEAWEKRTERTRGPETAVETPREPVGYGVYTFGFNNGPMPWN